jgi:hypothetical protein
MDKEETLKEINHLNDEANKLFDDIYDKASDMAVGLVIQEARNILKKDNGLHEFIMAMGTCFFTAKECGKYDPMSYSDEEAERLWEEGFQFADKSMIMRNNSLEIFIDFFEMVEDLNFKFKVCGYPTRFTATSKEVHDWGDTRKDPVVYEEVE